MALSRLGWLLFVVCFTFAVLASAATFQEDFTRPSTLHGFAFGKLQWRTVGSAPRATAQGIQLQGTPTLALPSALPSLETFRLAIEFRIDKRTSRSGWAVGGLELHYAADDYWRLEVVEDPDFKTHRLELVEKLSGTWQAQGALSGLTEQRKGHLEWHYGEWYRLELSLSPDQLTGRLVSLAEPAELLEISYDLSKSTSVVKAGKPAFYVGGLLMTVRRLELEVPHLQLAHLALGSKPKVALVTGDLPGYSGERTRLLESWLKADGYEVFTLPLEALSAGDLRSRCDLLVLPAADYFPAEAVRPLNDFLERRGRLLCLGAAPFEHLVVKGTSGYTTVADLLSKQQPKLYLLSDFSHLDLANLQHSSGNPDSTFEVEVVNQAPPGLPNSLEVRLGDLENWDNFLLGEFASSPFTSKRELTCIWAKGEKGRSLTLEWNEEDGSRWIATLELTGDWHHFVLRPEDFKFWRDGSPPERSKTHFNPLKAVRLRVGPASGFGSFRKGPMTYWLAGLGLAPNPLPEGQFAKLPELELLYPWFKHWWVPVETTARAARDAATLESNWRIASCAPFVTGINRPRATLFGAGFPGRFIPMVENYDASGRFRGYLASLYFSYEGALDGAAWGYMGIEDERFFLDHKSQASELVLALVQALLSPAKLISAGPEQYSYIEKTAAPLVVGASFQNVSAQPLPVRLEITLVPREGGKARTFSGTTRLAPLEFGDFSHEVPLDALKEGYYEVRTRLLVAERVVDTLTSEVLVLKHLDFDPEEVVQVKAGRFFLHGKPWYAHGVNYWPQYVSGMERSAYWGHWTRPSNYQPDFVQRDLELLKSLGMNSLSIQFGAAEFAPAVCDFFYRCKQLGLKVNLFLPQAHPLHFQPDYVAALARQAHLSKWDNIWCYDVAWEPHLGDHKARKWLDEQWVEWIKHQYGSIAAAEKEWRFSLPKENGKYTNPSDQQLLEDGPWRVMVAAYRRFVEDLVSRGYGRVVRKLRALGLPQLVGARSGYGGTGEPWPDRVMAFDLVSGAKHLDFTSPEGYGMAPEWSKARAKGFVTAYGRWAGNGKPVFWAEFGASVYPARGAAERAAKLEHQRKIWEDMYKVCLVSYANGEAGWWWPGGYRQDERSDFGIIAPDYTIRPAAQMALDYASKLKEAHAAPQPVVTIVFDRDKYTRGFSAVWKAHLAEYIDALEQGRWVRLITPGTGTTTATMPKVAIGNTPLNGHNPPKYANAEFNWLRVKDEAGKWVEVQPGARIEVKYAEPVLIQVSLGNTGEAEWLPSGKGEVMLRALEPSELGFVARLSRPVPRYDDYDFGELQLCGPLQQPLHLTLRAFCKGAGFFGETRSFTLVPR